MTPNADAKIRLDRLLSTLSLGSRSQVRELIHAGRVEINGTATVHADHQVLPGDIVTVDHNIIDARITRHVMLYKPSGVLTAARDKKQPTVLDLLPPVFSSIGCMPAGRLDKDTEGLLLLTTDGELTHRLLSPKRHVWKRYLATVDGPLSDADVTAFSLGLSLSDFDALPAKLDIVSSTSTAAVGIVWVREGKFHQVKRMFAARDRTVTTLKRLSFGPLELDDSLPPGRYRELTDAEVAALYSAVSGGEVTA